VDVNPGDRQEECGGLMKPVDIYYEHQNWILVHECEYCGEKKRNRVAENDDTEAVVKLQKVVRDKKMKK